MNKMIRTGLLILLAVSMLLTTATAGEVIISEREKASRLADKVMEEKYGKALSVCLCLGVSKDRVSQCLQHPLWARSDSGSLHQSKLQSN